MLPGMVYLVSIHMVPLVPRGPVGKVYGDVPDAYQTPSTCAWGRSGKAKGLNMMFGVPRVVSGPIEYI